MAEREEGGREGGGKAFFNLLPTKIWPLFDPGDADDIILLCFGIIGIDH